MTALRLDYAAACEPRRLDSGDGVLDRVWDISATTLRAGMMPDALVDNNSREQAQWLGDLCVTGLAAWHTFGDVALWRRGLRMAAQSQQPDGALNSVLPSEPTFMCIADYSMQWLASLWELQVATGCDLPLLQELLPAATALLVSRQLSSFKK